MNEVRQFMLINEKGEFYNLMDINHWLKDITGLGRQASPNVNVSDTGNAVVSSVDESVLVIGGVMTFNDNDGTTAYQKYRAFNSYLSKSKRVWLEYTPPGLDTVKAEIFKRVSPDKKEMSGNKLLVPIKITTLEYWQSTDIVRRLITSEAAGKRYGNKYTYRYGSGAIVNNELNNEEDHKLPLKLLFAPPFTNPRVDVIDKATGAVVSSWQWKGEVADGDYLLMDSNGGANEQRIEKNYTNVYQNLNFGAGFSSFIYAPPGEHYLKITSDGGGGDILMEYTQSFKDY